MNKTYWTLSIIGVIAASLIGFVSTKPTSDTGSKVNAVATTTAEVVRVIDGDTVRVRIPDSAINGIAAGTHSVRLIGIDAPEIDWDTDTAECFGYEARSRLRSIIKDTSVVLQTDPSQPLFDEYDRVLGYLLADGESTGYRLLADGYVRELTVGAGYSKKRLYQQAERTARESGRGLWRACRQ